MRRIDIYDAGTLSLRRAIRDYHPITDGKVRLRCHSRAIDCSRLLSCSFFGTVNALLVCTFVSLSVVSHARAAYSDPGFVPLPKKGIDFSDVKANDHNKVSADLRLRHFAMIIRLFALFGRTVKAGRVGAAEMYADEPIVCL